MKPVFTPFDRWTHRLALAAGLAVILCAAISSTAFAATGSLSAKIFTYNASANETNNVSIVPSGADILLTDSGANITTVSGCTKLSSTQIRCVAANVSKFVVNAGNMNDTVINSSSTNSRFVGGDGNDSLSSTSSTGTDWLEGNAGADTLNGGGAFDFFFGGDGNDTINAGSGEDDIDGGTGNDLVTYAGDTYGVYADLTVGLASVGPNSEHDYFHKVEDLTGGSADDILVGGTSGTRNVLRGGDGNDTITAGSVKLFGHGQNGNDSLTGGPADDDLQGQSGNDTLDGAGGSDLMSAGDGSDILIGGDGDDAHWGGAGSDTLTYSDRSAAVFLSFPLQWAGSGSEYDTMNQGDIENATGGDGDDEIHAADGVAGTIDCRGGSDVAHADLIDSVDQQSCEAIVWY